MVSGASLIDSQLALASSSSSPETWSALPLTKFFFALYLLMATQDIALDAWALTILQPQNRANGPVANSVGQNVGIFLAYVGFLSLEEIYGVSLGSFVKVMGWSMLGITVCVGLFKREMESRAVWLDGMVVRKAKANAKAKAKSAVLAAADGEKPPPGILSTYKLLGKILLLKPVQTMLLILLTYRFPTSLSDNATRLKLTEYGCPPGLIARLTPLITLPAGIIGPLVATRIFGGAATSQKDRGKGSMRQFLVVYRARVTAVILLDVLAVHAVNQRYSLQQGIFNQYPPLFWLALIASTAASALCSALMFNAQMSFFASRVDVDIGGSYMTLLNTFANLGGTWPASPTLGLLGKFSNGIMGVDPYFVLQGVMGVLGLVWLGVFGRGGGRGVVEKLAEVEVSEWIVKDKERDWIEDDDEV